MKTFVFSLSLFSSLILAQCQSDTASKTDSAKRADYNKNTKLILQKKAQFFTEYTKTKNKAAKLDEVGIWFDSVFVANVFPAWKNTAWDFNGTSDKPGQGVIACGYFVSTTLKHCGYNLNRYKLAQLGAKEAGEKLLGKNALKVISGTVSELETYFRNNCKPGLYFLGLDFHEGFLYFDNGNLYIIHSNYINSAGVMKEKAIESKALSQSKHFWFAPLGRNAELMKKWLYSTPI